MMRLGFDLHNERPRLYGGVELFLLPAFSEGCPATSRNAMACGVPMVALNLSGTPEKRELRERGFHRVSVFSYDSRTSLVLSGLPETVRPCKGH
jgi:glycosyltransferase involved in cell wall biosynthesis